jgi:hypothetical protein
MNAGITDPEEGDADISTSAHAEDRRHHSKIETIKGRLKDIVGLPPGDKTPDGAGRPPKRNTIPDGGLTSPDAEGLNPHNGAGFQVER